MIESIILTVAKTVGVPAYLLLAICTYESGLQNKVVHHDGGSASYGVCMVKKGTADMMGFKVTLSDLMDPEINATIAATYLKYQLDRYDNNICKATAGYNSGTYHPSSKAPGYPRNLKYLRKVQKLVDLPLKHKLQRCEG